MKDAGEKDNDDAQFAFISFYGIAFASIAVIVFFYMLVLLKICRRMRETRLAADVSGSSATSGLMRLLWKTICRVGIYPIFLVITLLPGTIHRLLPFEYDMPHVTWHGGSTL